MSVQVILHESQNFSLIRCRWLAMVTGRMPQINPYTTRDPFIQVFRGRLAETEPWLTLIRTAGRT
jgi:hypothetical protein